MAKKSDFSTFEWNLLKDSPYWVQTAINQAEGRMGLIEKRREGKALKNFLGSHKSGDALVTAVLAAQTGKHDVDPKTPLEKVGNTLEQIADIVEEKSSNRELDAFNDFLMATATAIAEATGENLLKKGDKVSDEEEEAMDLIAASLHATAADKAKRAAAVAAKRRAELKKQQETAKKIADAKKQAADAKQRAEEAKREAEHARQLAEAQKKAEEAEKEAKRREELAKKQQALQEARRARMAAARKERMAAKKAADEAAAAEAAAAEAAKRVYVVQPGDTLSGIALEIYGNANSWRKIHEANKDVIKNPGLIYPGQEFTIPE